MMRTTDDVFSLLTYELDLDASHVPMRYQLRATVLLAQMAEKRAVLRLAGVR